MRLFIRSLAAAVLALCLALPALAREEIRSFDSDVTLRVDGSVSVTETIAVNAEGNDIRRGIYRDIPVVMLGRDGGKVRPDLDVIDVQRDGRDEAFRVERMGNFQRIWIGDPETLLRRGVHTYEITYTMTRMARSFDDHDELYWNATGNYWIFPVLSASARVTLPDDATITDLTGYTGVVGSTEQAVASKRTGDGTATFRATRSLSAGEGMTVAVAFNKGVIAYPTGFAAIQQQLSDLREFILPALAALIALAYNALAWFRVGRDPARGVIIPLFHPPKGFSPPLTHYVHKWGFQNAGWPALTSAIFDLGVKRLVSIDNTDGKLTIVASGKLPESPLPAAEQGLFDFFSARRSTTIDKENGPTLKTVLATFLGAIQRENGSTWFKNNTGYTAFGIILAVALLGVLVLTHMLEVEWLIAAIVGGMFGGIAIGAIGRMLKSKGFLRYFTIAWVGIFLFNIGGGLLDTLSNIEINSAAIAALTIVVVTVAFASIMRAPTVQGRKVMDEIDGLKLYLETAEKDRMNMSVAPVMTVSRFERLLPYAIALGVEKPWSEHFEAELARNAVVDNPGSYHPAWYLGGDTPGSAAQSASSITNSVSAAAASMTAAMVAAQPVEASSSGFSGGGGGGGSSGGGGGGGGGGGW